MGIFDMFKNKKQKNIEEDKNSFKVWLDNVLKEELSSDIIAFNFNIYEDEEKKYSLELIGSSSYDKDNDDWASEEIFTSRDNIYVLDNTYLNDNYENVITHVMKIVRQYMYTGKYKEKLKQSYAICCGFVDGVLEIIYSNEKYRKVVDLKDIVVNSFDETLDFIKNNNVLWSKVFMQNQLNVQLSGYVKNTLEKEYDELVDKNIIMDFNGIAYENSTMAPGTIISKFRYIVINTTTGGNAICIDFNSSLDNPRIVYAEHSMFCDIEPGISNEEIWTKDLIDKNIKVISETFEEYVNNIKIGKLDIDDLDLE